MPERQIDTIDRKILTELQRDGRMTIQDLAGRIGLSASPCLRRVRMLEEAGILKGYVALVDQAKVGLAISVFASVKLERQREEELDRFAEAVARCDDPNMPDAVQILEKHGGRHLSTSPPRPQTPSVPVREPVRDRTAPG